MADRYWATIHTGSTKTEKDAIKLHRAQVKFNANFNTHNTRSMHYDFNSLEDVVGFVRVARKLPAKVTFGKGKIQLEMV